MLALLTLLSTMPASASDFEVSFTPTTGVCPGPHDLDVTGALPDTRIALITAEEVAGGFPVPGCGTNTTIGPSGINYRTTMRTDELGEIHTTVDIPSAACGLYVQGINTDTCAVGSVSVLGAVREDLPCACSGDYTKGDRVVAMVDEPSGATGVTAGSMGTVVAGIDGPLSVLVEWDDWLSGHDGNCSAAECGSCVDSPTTNRWWVACDDISRPGLTCIEDRYEPNDDLDSAPPLTDWFDDFCGPVSTRYIEGQLCEGDDDYFEVSIAEGEELTIRAWFDDGEGDIDLEMWRDGVVIDRSIGVGDSEVITLYSEYSLYGCSWDGEPCPPDPIVRVYLSGDDGAAPGNSYTLELTNEDFYYPDYCY